MKRLSLHPHLETLFALWADPREAAQAMSQTITDDFLDHIFIAEAAEDAPPIRIAKAGGALNGAFADGLQDKNLLSLFEGHDRTLLWSLLNIIKSKAQPALVRLRVRTDESATVDVDLALAPLGGGEPRTTRWLGFYQPNGPLHGVIQSQEIVAVHLQKPVRQAKA
ncbi:MAG: PAS domain-containing protein [Caulobacterales bacterium]